MLPMIVTVLTLGVWHAPPQGDCRYSEMRTADLAAAGISLLDIEAGAGSLRVEGKPGLHTIQVRGRACASSRALLAEVQLSARRTGSTFAVKTDGPDNVQDDDYARLDLVIEVPMSMPATVSDGSGSAFLSGLGELRVEDGSGELEIENIAGDVSINDGSGEISVADVQGNVDIDDGSGEVKLRDVRGTVTISDGSGDIDVVQVGGDFIVKSAGSGGVHHSGVAGAVRIPTRYRH